MKRIIFFVLVISPIFVFAQQPYTRYCTDGQIFTGIAHDNTGNPKIELVVDPAFNTKMKQERNTPDLPVAPIYDLVFRVVPTINEYCLPQYDENGAFIKKIDPPETLPFRGDIILGESITSTNVVIGPGSFVRAGKNERSEWLYEWKIAGWPNGITAQEKLERLIEAIAKNQSVNIVVTVPQKSGAAIYEKSEVSFTLCAPMWGSGKHGIVYMRGSGEGSFSDFSARTDKVIQKGFRSIEPFKKYEDNFSHFFDLTKNNEIFVWALKFFSREGNSEYKQRNLLSRFSEQSSCQGGTKLMYDAGSLGQGTFGVTAPFAHAAFISVSKFYEKEYPDKISVERTSVHEFSHAFAGLNDEAVYRSKPKNPRSFPPISKNCSTSPSSWSFNKKTYAQPFRGCSFDFLPGVRPGTDFFPLYRPSDDSIMNYRGSRMFNVVSCGYISEAIKGGDAKSYFPECAKMDGVIKDGVQASALYPFFAAIERIFSISSVGPQTAAVGESGSSPTGTGQYLIVESFDPENPWGEIIEVVPDSQTITPPTPTTQPPPAPPSDNLGVNAESIFDNISLDLKVNGKDGPVTITPGSRIVVSWISEGATRCRAVWSKNDIKLSGTAAGRLSRSVTIRAACINAEGERADDAVQVLIDTESS